MSNLLNAGPSLLFWAAVFYFFWRRAERRKVNNGPDGSGADRETCAGYGHTPSVTHVISPQASAPGSRSTRLTSGAGGRGSDGGEYPTYLDHTAHHCDTTPHYGTTPHDTAHHCDAGHYTGHH